MMSDLPQAHQINEWFPSSNQDRYVDTIVGQSGLTRRQATCFVRLWGYASLQQATEIPITTLSSAINVFSCSHSEAADLFYCDQQRGSERSAGMMIDQLVAKHLIRREPFDGGPTRLSLKILDSFLPATPTAHSSELYTDAFNVRNDVSMVAAFLEESYSWVNPRSETTSFKITKVLRRWAAQYPKGLRVLRKAADDEPMGFAALFPTHPASEKNFHLPPSLSLHLSTLHHNDPVQVAQPGDEACYTVFIRSWQIKQPYWNYSTVAQFLQDSQETLKQMQGSFPNLCDLYTIPIHPRLESLAFALGFKPLKADPNSSLRWIHTPLDRFLAVDIDEALVEFDFNLL
ncbi:MAG: hypothetical protein F6K42_29930 [Leptolyngbya sp. SIO1D8]|nr:hypothetical protein [Leptolyngbya sp. SIO1D8]